jgi:hypothetical protein
MPKGDDEQVKTTARHQYGTNYVPVPVELLDLEELDECPVCGEENLTGAICHGCQERLNEYVTKDEWN